ncbi:Nucleoporin nup85 [Podila humilis]|nr:Nucleoporin nup85 [Podila humilis]
MYLDPSPIGKGITAETWTQKNRTIMSTFRPNTNEIAVFVAGKKAAEEFPVEQHATEQDNTIFLYQASIPKIRVQFIKETFDVFTNTTSKNPYTAAFLYRENYDQYHESIVRYLDELKERSSSTMEIDDAEDIIKELHMVKDIDSIWKLAEHMFLVSDDEKPIALLLSEWIEGVEGSEEFDSIGKELAAHRAKIQHPDFWPYVNKCILRGMRKAVLFMVEEAWKEEDNDDVADALEGFQKILRGIPTTQTTVRDSKIKERHYKWQEECRKFARSSAVKALGDEASKTISILTGDLEDIFATSDSWKDALVAILLYTDPDRQRQDIGSTLDICISHFMTENDMTLVDRIIIAILQMDAIMTIRYSSSFDNPWLVAHLADVLQQHGFLDLDGVTLQEMTSSGLKTSIRDFYFINYAQSLISNTELWAIIAGYFLRCGHTGRTMLSTWICHVPLDSTEKANDVLAFCKENNLQESLQSINRVAGVEQEKLGRYDLAIEHFIASRDNDRVAKVVDNLMRKFFKDPSLDLFQSLGSLVELRVPNEHVEFLCLYSKFQQQKRAKKDALAGRQLMDLLAQEKAPKKYWGALLFDALPLLENKKLVFTSRDTYDLMRCLEEVVGSPHKTEYLQWLPCAIAAEGVSTEDRVLQLDVIRLSLAKNLARAMVHEPSYE